MMRQSAMSPFPRQQALRRRNSPASRVQIGELLFDRTAMMFRNAIDFGARLGFLRRKAKQIESRILQSSGPLAELPLCIDHPHWGPRTV
jgi:hypothetical protein